MNQLTHKKSELFLYKIRSLKKFFSLAIIIITIGIVLLNNSHSMGNEKIGILIVVVVENK